MGTHLRGCVRAGACGARVCMCNECMRCSARASVCLHAGVCIVSA